MANSHNRPALAMTRFSEGSIHGSSRPTRRKILLPTRTGKHLAPANSGRYRIARVVQGVAATFVQFDLEQGINDRQKMSSVH
jgi:hypothetical protein